MYFKVDCVKITNVKRKLIIVCTVIALIISSIACVGCGKKDAENVNLVIQVEFSDTENHFSKADASILAKAFNGSTNSLDNFIYVNSNGNRTLKSNILGVVKIDKPIDYFMPRYRYDEEKGEYVEVNAKGYDNRYFDDDGTPSLTGKQSVERFYREQELLYLATANAKALTKKLGRKPKFENVTIVPSKLNRYVYSGDIFHPHQGLSYTGEGEGLSTAYYTEGISGAIKVSKIRKSEVGSYVIIPYAYMYDGNALNVTTLCHEYMHVLGVPDMYSYDKSIKPVGEFDVMGGEDTAVPTESLSYVKYKMGWLKEGKDILPVTGSGEYNLTAVEDKGGVKAYKITLASHYETGDVFYLEYRKLGEGSLAENLTEGVIIYRVNEDNGYISSNGEKTNVWRGNAYGDYEVNVFRNIKDLVLGKHTTLCEEEGYTVFGNPGGNLNVILNSDGTNSDILVSYLGVNADGTARVKIDLPQEEIVAPTEKTGLKAEIGNRHSFYFDRVDSGCDAYIFYSPKDIKNPTADKLLRSEKGELIVVNTAFLKVTLPSAKGFEKYVYVFYKDDGGYSQVVEYKIKGVKNIKLAKVFAIAIGMGIVVPSALLTLVTKLSKSKRKK